MNYSLCLPQILDFSAISLQHKSPAMRGFCSMYFYFLQTSGLSDVVACLQRILERVCLCRILFRFHNKPAFIVRIAQRLEYARIIDTAITRNRKAAFQHSSSCSSQSPALRALLQYSSNTCASSSNGISLFQ